MRGIFQNKFSLETYPNRRGFTFMMKAHKTKKSEKSVYQSIISAWRNFDLKITAS